MAAAPEWHFKGFQPGDTIRDPIQGEFFATDAIRDAAEALVREAIQNSLDARLGEVPAKVRIYLSEDDGLPGRTMRKYMYQGEAHFAAKGNGLQNAPSPQDACSFAVIEDFNTTGLTGDAAQWEALEAVPNSFFDFFRAEGRSDKQESERGRWGVGKFVFPRSSRNSTFFGLSVRADDKKRMLMGRCILKSHRVGGKLYVSDGYFGTQDTSGLVLPIVDVGYIDAFAREFHLTRREEPGLSVVVPWVEPDLGADNIIRSVVRDYFYPILDGSLMVIVETPRGTTRIEANTIQQVIAYLDEDFRDEVLPLLRLAEWARGVAQDEHFMLCSQTADKVPNWAPTLISDDVSSKVREKFDAGERVAVRVPVWVDPQAGSPVRSSFDVYMMREGTYDAGRPCFLRDGVIISDVKGGRTRGLRSLVVVKRGPLATLLGDSENPAHTQWQKDSSHFRNRPGRDKKTIGFVVNSVASILRLITDSDSEEDETSLLDFFFLPPREGEVTKRRKDEPPPPPPPPPKPQPFRVTRVERGFTVTRGDTTREPARVLDVMVAYQTRRGNPFVQYDRADFVVDRPPIHLEQRGLEVLFRKDNRIQAAIREPDFSLTVTGFDGRRDLRIRVQPKEQADAADA